MRAKWWLAGLEVNQTEMTRWLKQEDEPEYNACSDYIMSYFFNGVIVYRRGKDDRFSKPEL